MAKGPTSLRLARASDLEALVRLEEATFASERITPRQMRYLLGRPSALFVVVIQGARLLGYALVLFRSGTRVARLYSLAVSHEARGRGLGCRLVRECVRRATLRSCITLRLEVRARDRRVRRLYERLGFVECGRLACFYEDGADGVRMERSWSSPGGAHGRRSDGGVGLFRGTP